jgi:hypothetical protein
MTNPIGTLKLRVRPHTETVRGLEPGPSDYWKTWDCIAGKIRSHDQTLFFRENWV